MTLRGLRSRGDRTTPGRIALLLAVVGTALTLAACGSSGSTDEATAPSNLDQPATGSLRVFAYEDSVTPEMMDPFQSRNPDLEIKTATFDSDSEAAAKLAGGFKADVVEVCLDEAKPLLTRGLLRPIDTSGVNDWSRIAFNDSEGVRQDGTVIAVPLSAGPEGIIINTDEVKTPVTSFHDLFDPQFDDRAALEGDYPLVPIAVSALAMGIEDPMNLSSNELDRVAGFMDEHRSHFRALWRSDSDLVNLFKSGEVVIANGNSAQVKRMQEDGLPVEWISPDEGTISWVCGFGISSGAQNLPAAYRLINWQASPKAQAIRGRNGYVVTNPGAMALIPKADHATADPSSLKSAIPETSPPSYNQWVRVFEAFQASG